MSVSEVPTPAELRAEIARQQIPRYKLAAAVGLHPARLGQMLVGSLPMPDRVAERVAAALAGGADAFTV